MRFALWLLKLCGYIAPNNYAHLDSIIEAAIPLVKQQAMAYADRSGEAKKHAVYANLIKSLPEVSKRDISLAIEFAIRRLDAR